MNNYKRLAGYMKPYFSRLISAVFCMVAIGALTAFLMWLIKPVMNEIFSAKKVNMIIPLGAAIILASFIKGIFIYIQAYLMSFIGQRVVLDMRNQLFKHISVLSMDFYTKQPTGKLMSRITNDINIIQFSMTNVPANIIRDGVTFIFLAGLAFYLNWKLAFIALFVFPVAVYPIVKFGRKLRMVSTSSQKQMARLYNLLFETITGIKVIKAFSLEENRKHIFYSENKNFFNITMRSMRVLAMTSPIMEFIGAIAIASIIVIGGFQVSKGYLSQGDFFAFIGAIVSLYNPIKNLSNLNNVIQQSVAASNRVFEILDTKPSIYEVTEAKTLPQINKDIVFDNVTFEYIENITVLHNISFKIDKGEMIALVGPSGGGKSTIINLIPRFYDAARGRILIDGHDVSKVTLHSLLSQIGLVTQDVVLFNDSVENNIRYGKLDASFDEIVNAAKFANAHLFVEQLPEGYGTLIGEHGARLSGGQRQRIAIARAILKDPKILILDEATSALDSESERLVQEALEHLIKNRTTLVVAHRLSTIRKADRIMVIDGGRIIESGMHKDLLSKNGLYAKLYRLQFSDLEL
ncbi:lipid A export permease/ATP-binding protein MsbA [bacterium]